MGLELTVEYFVWWIMFLFPVGEESNYCILPNITLCRLSQVRNQLGWAVDGQRTFPVSVVNPLSVRYEHCYQPDIYAMYVSCLCSQGEKKVANISMPQIGQLANFGVPKSETFIDVDRLRFSVSSCYFWSWSTEEGAWTWRGPFIPAAPAVPVVYYCGHAGNKSGTIVETTWFVWFIGNNTVCTNILLSKPAHFDILWILRIRHWQLHTLSLVGGFCFSNVQYVACILPLKDIQLL
jgi:hypothetical protein